MSFIIQIDTALKTACISLSSGGNLLCQEENTEMKDHGAFVQPAVEKILTLAGISAHEISAIAVSYGPGSYTGLRVGMASAKGLSYALSKPLITIGSLQILTKGVLDAYNREASTIYCPMIDARRMEVFTALFDAQMNELLPPSAAILDKETYANWLLKNNVWFFGDGSAKFSTVVNHPRAIFKPEGNNTLAMSKLAFEKYNRGEFADNAYVEPLYVKEFFSPVLPS